MMTDIKKYPGKEIIYLAAFGLVSSFYAACIFFSLGPKFGSFEEITSFYPLLFLPLFIKKTDVRSGAFIYIEIIFYSLLLIASIAAGVLSGVWIAFVWISLSLLSFYRINVHILGKFLLLLCPPFIEKYSLVFGFQLKLLLTKNAGIILNKIDPGLQVIGNSIIFRGKEFLVDDACQGLKMGVALIVLLLIFVYKNISKRKPDLKNILFILSGIAVSIILWIAANQLRIIILIFLDIPPDSAAHYAIGLVLFFGINVFPLLAVNEIVSTSKNTQSRKNNSDKNQKKINLFYPAIPIVFIIFMGIAAVFIKYSSSEISIPFPDKLGPFSKEESLNTESFFGRDYEITSYKNAGDYLILKNNLYPLRIIHHPKQCFEGAGYKFITEYQDDLHSGNLRIAELIKDNQIFNLVWWYESVYSGADGISVVNADGTGKYYVTASEIDWRYRYLFEKTKYIQVSLLTEKYDYEKTLEIINSIMQKK